MKKYFVFLVISAFVSQTIAQEKPDHKEISKTIFGLMQKKDFTRIESYFDTSFAKRMTLERLDKLWKFVSDEGGAYVQTKEITEEVKPVYSTVVQTLEFAKKVFDLKVVFNRKEKISNLSFIPNHPVESYKLPAYYDSTMVEEKRVKITSGDFALPGTLSLPKTGSKFPAVVLVHGAGANDRDETVAATKMFKDIALGLGMKGIAVLRYDKRTKVAYGKMMQQRNKLTVKEETIDDVVAAVQSLKSNPAIDTTRIVLLGHSLGGMLLPRIAKQLPGIAGLIMVNANARPLEDLIFEQSSYLLATDSMTERRKALLDTMKIHVNKIKHLKASTPDTSIKTLLALPVAYWIDLNSYHQVDVAKKSNVPMYFLQGERDFQVPMTDFNLWKKGLAEKTNAQFKLYPKLNHLFQEGVGKSVPAEYDKQANVPLYVIDDLAKWIKQRKK